MTKKQYKRYLKERERRGKRESSAVLSSRVAGRRGVHPAFGPRP